MLVSVELNLHPNQRRNRRKPVTVLGQEGEHSIILQVAGRRHLREPALEEKAVVQFRYSSSSARRKR